MMRHCSESLNYVLLRVFVKKNLRNIRQTRERLPEKRWGQTKKKEARVTLGFENSNDDEGFKDNKRRND